jgi:polysaccharide biosynthesis/export protein
MRPLILVLAAIVAGVASCASSPEVRIPAAPPAEGGYLIQAGDLLQVTVWKEADLTGEVLVRSDGGLSFPLVGDLTAAGKTVETLRDEFTKRLKNYIPDPVVTIATKQMGGNQIYVIGRVQRPGGYPFVKPLDVMEALSLAGGGTPFASLNSIIILRRENGQQSTIPFRYSDVAHGKKLAQNIVLESGDTVVVP